MPTVSREARAAGTSGGIPSISAGRRYRTAMRVPRIRSLLHSSCRLSRAARSAMSLKPQSPVLSACDGLNPQPSSSHDSRKRSAGRNHYGNRASICRERLPSPKGGRAAAANVELSTTPCVWPESARGGCIAALPDSLRKVDDSGKADPARTRRQAATAGSADVAPDHRACLAMSAHGLLHPHTHF